MVLSLSACSTTPQYGKKIKYRLNEPLVYPDLTITCTEVGSHPSGISDIPFRRFEISTSEESFNVVFAYPFQIATGNKIYTLDPMPGKKLISDDYVLLTYPDNGKGGTAFFEKGYKIIRELQQNQSMELMLKTPVE